VTSPHNAPRASRSRIVVIEDDVVVTETLALYLGQAGYDVDVVRDGIAGLARAQAADVALVVLDWMRAWRRRLRAEAVQPA
jgi:DNA-binding response OmpR family regulator